MTTTTTRKPRGLPAAETNTDPTPVSASADAMRGVQFAAEVAPAANGQEFEADAYKDEGKTSNTNKAEFDAERNALNQAAAKRSSELSDARPRAQRSIKPIIPPLSEDKAAELKPTRYRVTSSLGPINVEGQRIHFRVGKVLDSNQYPIEMIKQQGVQLEAI